MPAHLVPKAWNADNAFRFVLASRTPIAEGCELLDQPGQTVAKARKCWTEGDWHLARFESTPYGKARHPDLRLHVAERRVSLLLERPLVARIAPPLTLADMPALPSRIAGHLPWLPRTAVVVPFPVLA